VTSNLAVGQQHQAAHVSLSLDSGSIVQRRATSTMATSTSRQSTFKGKTTISESVGLRPF